MGGHGYLGISAVTKRFLGSWDGGARGAGVYDSLSGFSHPSHMFLNELLTWIELEDRKMAIWDVDSEFVLRLAVYSCRALNETTRAIGAYVGR